VLFAPKNKKNILSLYENENRRQKKNKEKNEEKQGDHLIPGAKELQPNQFSK
jgi:hypothetical protein